MKACVGLLVLVGCLGVCADPFGDARMLLRGPVDADASGTVNLTNEFPNALSMDDATHWTHKLKLHAKCTNQLDKTVNNYPQIVEEDVVSPLLGFSAGRRKCIQFRQLVEEESGGINRELLTMTDNARLSVSNTTGWSVYLRVRPEGGSTVTKNEDNSWSWSATLSRFCHYWSGGGSGVKISISGSPTAGYWNLMFGGEGCGLNSMKDSVNTRLVTNKWTDLVFTVTNHVVKVYSMREGGTLYTIEKPLAQVQAVTNKMTHILTLGGHEDDSGTRANFVGLWSDFAYWTRPLDEGEVLNILNRGCGISRNFELGARNGSSGEFMGAANGEVAVGSDAEWRVTPPSLAPGDSVTIRFNSATNCHNAAQALLFAATPTSAEKELDVSLNGTAVGKLRAKAGETTLLIVKPKYFVPGANALVISSDAMGGTVELDKVTLAGGWQYGARDTSSTDLAGQNGALNFYVGNTNCTASGIGIKSILHSGGKQTNSNCIFHVSFPDGMELVKRFKFQTRGKGSTEGKWSTVPGNPNQQFKLLVNDVCAGEFAITNVWKDVTLDIPGEFFDVAKDNTIKVQGVTPLWYDPEAYYVDSKYGVYAWVNFDYFRLEPQQYRGIIVNFR